MSERHRHATHPDLVKRLKRADGHLRHVIEMIEADRPCADIAMQLQAVERAITNAKRTLIHDHIDHCLDDLPAPDDGAIRDSFAEFRKIAKYL
jgi:DNA-binding FrmR family transcriptional regulator